MVGVIIKSSKDFMHKFLMSETFGDFLLVEGKVIAANTFIIDGHMQKEFFTKEEWEDEQVRPYDYASWNDMKSFVFSVVKGKHTPVMLKFTLQLKPEITHKLFQEKGLSGDEKAYQIGGFLCNMKYENGTVHVTTGVSYTGFTMDKEPEKLWDQYFIQFLEKSQIDYQM